MHRAGRAEATHLAESHHPLEGEVRNLQPKGRDTLGKTYCLYSVTLTRTIMAKNNDVHTVPADDGWTNKVGGAQRGEYDTQEEAAEAGRNLAQQNQSEHHLHGRNGQIRERRSYGNDPYPPEDRD